MAIPVPGRNSRPLFGCAILALVLSCRPLPPKPTPLPSESKARVESKVALVVFAAELGRLTENVERLTPLVAEAFRNGADWVVTPELATTGYSITAQEVAAGLGLEHPFSALEPVAELARFHQGYLFVGIAEVSSAASGDELYNSVVVFGPHGLVGVQRKRGIAEWNERGEQPFLILETPLGDVATLVCSDTYLMDWPRLVAVSGADLLLSPANWWGDSGQLRIWQTRARENGLWMVVANRRGKEVDSRYEPAPTYQMDDAPSAVIGPQGQVELLYRPEEEPEPRDTILYATLAVEESRLGVENPTHTVKARQPAAYEALANAYYRRDEGNLAVPGLPPPGPAQVAVLSYVPDSVPARNLERIKTLLRDNEPHPDILVLPGLGLSAHPVELEGGGWYESAPWSQFQDLVEKRRIHLAVTTVLGGSGPGGEERLFLLLAAAGSPPRLFPQIHDAWGMAGSGEPPPLIDLPHTRVGVLAGIDSLFPETVAHLAKSGADLVVVSSQVGRASPGQGPGSLPRLWTAEALLGTWRTRTNHCLHLAAADASGLGLLVRDGGCFTITHEIVTPESPFRLLSLDSTSQRHKKLNTYLPSDLDVLLAGVD